MVIGGIFVFLVKVNKKEMGLGMKGPISDLRGEIIIKKDMGQADTTGEDWIEIDFSI